MSDFMLHAWAAVEQRLAGASERLRGDERGQAMVEYGLILALVSVVALAVVLSLGTELQSAFNRVVNTIREYGLIK
jgi:pilus assembly protein Flp/PilA